MMPRLPQANNRFRTVPLRHVAEPRQRQHLGGKRGGDEHHVIDVRQLQLLEHVRVKYGPENCTARLNGHQVEQELAVHAFPKSRSEIAQRDMAIFVAGGVGSVCRDSAKAEM